METISTLVILAVFVGLVALWIKFTPAMVVGFAVLYFGYNWLVEVHALFYIAIPMYALAGIAALLFVLGKKTVTFFRNVNEHVQKE